MAKRYVCARCKEKFRDPIKFTQHVKACKSGRLPRKEGKCPECGETVKMKGMGSHRKAKHGVEGSSRQAVRARKKNGAPPAPRAEQQTAPAPQDQAKREIIRKLVEKADEHRAIGMDHTKKAEELTRMAASLRDLI